MTSSSEAPAMSSPPKMELRKLGKYELQKQLGAGGMGAVYLAKDTQLKRLVALKILPRDKAANPTLVRRFQSEAQAAAQLRHDHIVAVYENGEIDGYLFIAMEYVDGMDLHELIRKRGKIPIKRSIEIVKQVAQALKHADEHHIVHRDIKPSNLLIRNDGVVKLTDLGLARSVDDTLETDITRAGTTVGTVDYMAPEQGRSSKSADIRSDIYSLGCTWYHMLTGRPPFSEGSLTNKLQAHATRSPPNPQEFNDNVTEAMVAVLHRMLAKKPDDRYQTPAEFLEDLARPSLTRGGAVQEVLTAIQEDSETVAEAPKAKRVLAPGQLPPKKKDESEEEEKSSLFDWETLQPLLWGALMLSAIAGLGLIVAWFSGGLDFGSQKLVKPDENLRPKDNGSSVVVSPKTDGTPAQPAQAVEIQPGMNVVNSPDGNTPNPDDPQPANPPAPDGGANTVVSPNNPSSGNSAQTPRDFNPDEIPGWSKSPSVREQIKSAANPNAPAPVNPNGKTAPPGTKQGTEPAAPTGFSAATLKNFTVGPGSVTASHFRNLAEALKTAPPEGAVIRFTGPGPFVLPQVTLKQIRRVTLVADDGQKPIIVVRPAAGESTAGLQLAEGVLELEGLQFVVDRSAFIGSDPVRIANSIDGQLTVRQCTFSVWGQGTVPVIALQVDSHAELQGQSSIFEPRVLIDQVLVKGDHVTALAVMRPTADVVIRESLLACGQQPAVVLSGKLSEVLAKSQNNKPRRAVRLLQSTLYGNRALFQASADGSSLPPTTAVLLQESVCATGGPATESALLDASAWPQTAAAAAGARLVHLSWTMKDSLAIGFGRLADLGAASALQAQHLDGWQTLWAKTFPAGDFPAGPWPAPPVADVSSAMLAAFDRATLPPTEVRRAADQSPPGGDVALLTDLDPKLRRQLAATAAKPAFPAISPASSPSPVKLDISKQQDLGTLLQNGAWPPGTVLEVVGSGVKQMTPVKLVDKSWKLVWRPQDGAPLTLAPKAANDLSALIEIERGSLELENLRFQIPAARKSSLSSLISARGARLVLENVWLQGLLSENNTLESLLSWSGESPAANAAAPFLLCRDSLFTGSGSSLRLTMGSAPVFLTNCLLVSRSDAVDLRFPPLAPGQPAGPLVADHVTISASWGAFHLAGGSAEQGQPAHRFYVDQCVFAPPLALKGDDRTPTIFSAANPATDFARVEWWGTSNGVAPEIPAMIRADRDLKPNPDESGLARWQVAFGPDQDQRFLTGPGGVVMTDQFSNRPGSIKPTQFALHLKSKAARWGEDDSPIGADLKQLELPPATPKPKDTGGKAPVAPKKPVTTQADF